MPTSTVRTLYELPGHIIKLNYKENSTSFKRLGTARKGSHIPLKLLQTRGPFIGYTRLWNSKQLGEMVRIFFFISKKIKQVVNKYALAYLFRISHPLQSCMSIFVAGSHRSERRRLEKFKQILPFGEIGLFSWRCSLWWLGCERWTVCAYHLRPFTHLYLGRSTRRSTFGIE